MHYQLTQRRVNTPTLILTIIHEFLYRFVNTVFNTHYLVANGQVNNDLCRSCLMIWLQNKSIVTSIFQRIEPIPTKWVLRAWRQYLIILYLYYSLRHLWVKWIFIQQLFLYIFANFHTRQSTNSTVPKTVPLIATLRSRSYRAFRLWFDGHKL